MNSVIEKREIGRHGSFDVTITTVQADYNDLKDWLGYFTDDIEGKNPVSVIKVSNDPNKFAYFCAEDVENEAQTKQSFNLMRDIEKRCYRPF